MNEPSWGLWMPWNLTELRLFCFHKCVIIIFIWMLIVMYCFMSINSERCFTKTNIIMVEKRICCSCHFNDCDNLIHIKIFWQTNKKCLFKTKQTNKINSCNFLKFKLVYTYKVYQVQNVNNSDHVNCLVIKYSLKCLNIWIKYISSLV